MPDLLHDKTKMLELIRQKSGKSAQEIEALAKEKQNKFSGLLTEEGALFLIAKETGISFELEKTVSEFVQIAQLENNMQGIDLRATVKQIFPPKEFERNGKKGTRCSLVVSDDTGEITLTLWHKDVKKLDDLNVEKGTVLLLKECFVSEYNGAKQLNISFKGGFEVLERTKESSMKKLKEMVAGINDASAIARVQQVFEPKKFEKVDGKGELCTLILNDGSATMRAIAWGDLVKQAQKLDAGDLVKITGAYTKQGMKGIEIHLGNRARIIKNPKIDFPELSQLLKQGAVKKSIATLQEGAELQQISAEIIEMNPSLYFLVCPKCGKKPERFEGKLICNDCGEVKNAEMRLVLSTIVSDSSGVINAVFYGELAEQLSGLTGIQLEQELEAKSREQVLDELKLKLVGKKITLFGNVKRNKISNEPELSAKAIET